MKKFIYNKYIMGLIALGMTVCSTSAVNANEAETSNKLLTFNPIWELLGHDPDPPAECNFTAIEDARLIWVYPTGEQSYFSTHYGSGRGLRFTVSGDNVETLTLEPYYYEDELVVEAEVETNDFDLEAVAEDGKYIVRKIGGGKFTKTFDVTIGGNMRPTDPSFKPGFDYRMHFLWGTTCN